MVYTRKETAELLKIGLRTLDKLIQKGELAYYRIGRQIRIPEKAIHDMLEANQIRFDGKPKAEVLRPVLRQ